MESSEADAGGSMPATPLKSLVESLLFVADEPVRIDRLAQVLGVGVEPIERAVAALAAECEQRGVRLQRTGSRVQMVTAPEASEYVRRLLGLEHSTRLSAAALETLAIVAYRQPITRAQIEAVRGVNSDTVLRTLVSHGLVVEQGRLDQAGRPFEYGTGFEFLQQFGLRSLDQLPPLEGWDPTAGPHRAGDRSGP